MFREEPEVEVASNFQPLYKLICPTALKRHTSQIPGTPLPAVAGFVHATEIVIDSNSRDNGVAQTWNEGQSTTSHVALMMSPDGVVTAKYSKEYAISVFQMRRLAL